MGSSETFTYRKSQRSCLEVINVSDVFLYNLSFIVDTTTRKYQPWPLESKMKNHVQSIETPTIEKQLFTN